MADLICNIEQGSLKGQRETNIDGGSFVSFQGIPYAKPPLGKLRFKDPKPPESWKGIRDATKEGNPCSSLQSLPKVSSADEELSELFVGSEDCLFLNVFTRQLPSKSGPNKLVPVMVYIHGGGFTGGSSQRVMCGPEFLMTEDIVLVTLNYRLGSLGFLKIDDPLLGVTGNAGLKDMVQALKWIQSNIKQFGGDAANVTIFGVSAGGAAVHYLVLSPLAKGLFHKAIAQSGTSLCAWTRGVNDAKTLAKIIGCTETDNAKILEFLQQVPVEKLIRGQIKLTDWLHCVKKRPFSPSIEAKTPNAFLSEEPKKLINSGDYNHVPMMFGYTKDEGLCEEIFDVFGMQRNVEEFVPYYLGLKPGTEAFKEINNKIVKFYYGSEQADPNNKEALHVIQTDNLFLRGIYVAVRGHAKTSQKPVYYYRMSLDAELNTLKKMFNIKFKGAAHGDDMGYLFKTGNSSLKPGTIEEKSVRRFVKMWTNFAKIGEPIPVKDSLLNAEWKPVTKDELNFMDIGANLVSGIDPDIDRMKFWDELCKGFEEKY